MATITSSKAGNWSDPTVWTGGVVPGIADYASALHIVEIDQNITVLGLKVTTPAYFTISGNTTRSVNLTATDSFQFLSSDTTGMVRITNIGTTTINTYFVSSGTLNVTYIFCNSVGGIININVLGGWIPNNGGSVTSVPIVLASTSQNQVVNVIGNVVTTTQPRPALEMLGTNNTLNLTGDVRSSSTSGTTPILSIEGTNCTFNYTGTLTTNLSPLINTANTTASININGIVIGGTSSNNAIISSSTALVKISGVITQFNNVNPVFVKRLRIDNTLNTTWTYNTDVVGTNITLNTSAEALNLPSISNVRLGTIYGQTGQYTGSLYMAIPANVRKGVPTDNTVGTADLTIADFWNTLTANLTTSDSIGKLLKDNVDAQISTRATNAGVVNELNTSNVDIAVRLRNCSTVETTGNQIAN